MVAVLVPPVTLNATLLPPVVRAFPNVSLACRVSVAIAPDNTLVAGGGTTHRGPHTPPAGAGGLKLAAGGGGGGPRQPRRPARGAGGAPRRAGAPRHEERRYGGTARVCGAYAEPKRTSKREHAVDRREREGGNAAPRPRVGHRDLLRRARSSGPHLQGPSAREQCEATTP